MFLRLRILFTILSALCLAAIIPVAVWAGMVWFAVVGVGALFFFALMLLCKQEQEKREQQEKPQPKQADFLQPTNNEKHDE